MMLKQIPSLAVVKGGPLFAPAHTVNQLNSEAIQLGDTPMASPDFLTPAVVLIRS